MWEAGLRVQPRTAAKRGAGPTRLAAFDGRSACPFRRPTSWSRGGEINLEVVGLRRGEPGPGHCRMVSGGNDAVVVADEWAERRPARHAPGRGIESLGGYPGLPPGAAAVAARRIGQVHEFVGAVPAVVEGGVEP